MLEGRKFVTAGFVTKKLMMIGALAVLLMIPMQLILSRVHERESYQNDAKNDVGRVWGRNTVVHSPWLSQNGVLHGSSVNTTKIKIDEQFRERGQYRVPVHVATVTMTADFSAIPMQPINPKLANNYSISLENVEFVERFKIRDADTGKDLPAKLLSRRLVVGADVLATQAKFPTKLLIELVVRGSDSFMYRTGAASDHITMSGNWEKPAFQAVSPSDVRPSPDGFEASWVVSVTSVSSESALSVGVRQTDVNRDYDLTVKATKYAILFIALTFLLVFIAEFRSKVRFHPLQYILIGSAICVFYLLLLAISEKTGFAVAYLTAGIATAALVVAYVHGFIRQKKFVYLIGLEQVAMLGFFYVLLNLEDIALLVGSIAVFAVLATLMLLTRKIDWYSSEDTPRIDSHEAINPTI